MCAALICVCGANAVHTTPAQLRQASAKSQPFRWAPKSKAEKADWSGVSAASQKALKAPKTDADVTLPESDNSEYLDMPDGKTWFVSTKFDKEIISQNEYYTEYAITGIHSTIYNENYQPVGVINSPVQPIEGMSYCSHAEFGPAVTQKFFNTDNSYEVMLMLNFRPENDYGAVPYTYVFSLKGAETDAELLDVIPGYYVTAVNNPASNWSEDFFIEFFTNETYTDTEILYTFDIFSKANYNSPKPQKVDTYTVDMLYATSNGDNESAPVLINTKGRDLYVTVAKYEKTFFEDPFDFTNDRLSEDNHYLIDLYKKGENDTAPSLISHTSIPVEEPGDGYMMRSYCLGIFSGYDDISFDFSNDNDPVFVLTVTDSDFNSSSESFFRVYDRQGSGIKEFGKNNYGYLRLSDIKGFDTQYCFIESTGDGDNDFEFAFYDYPSLRKLNSVPIIIEDDGEFIPLSMSLDRVKDGSSYSYVISGRYGYEDEQENTLHYVAWFDRQGNLTGVDRLNAGRNVEMINPFIGSSGLGRFIFNTDEAREYMLFAKRLINTTDSQTRTELMIVNDRQETLLQYPFDINDTGIFVAIVNNNDTPALWINYTSHADNLVHSEFIKLPLNQFEGSGTLADPYLLKTPGDMAQVKNNLNKNFRIANDIDFNGDEFPCVKGMFTGTIDGDGHQLSNFKINEPMFSYLTTQNPAAKATIKNLSINKVWSYDGDAVLVGTAASALIEKVYMTDINVSGERDYFGSIAQHANLGTVISECGVQAHISLPATDEVGGIVSSLGNDSKINAAAFKGVITGATEVGGIAAYSFASAQIADCHVTAEITADHTVGGIVGHSARTDIKRCVAEGMITVLKHASAWSEFNNGRVNEFNAGGIVGRLDAKPVEYDQNGNVLPPDPNLPIVISDCVAALSRIHVTESDLDYTPTVHRIVGRTSVNNDPFIDSEEYDEESGDWVIHWGDPAPAEDKLADNYASADFAIIDSSVDPTADSAEGATKQNSELNKSFYESLGYAFSGNNADAPWYPYFNLTPELYFEELLSYYMEFETSHIYTKPANLIEVRLRCMNINSEILEFWCSDEENCYITDMRSYTEELISDALPVVNVADISVMVEKAGEYTITAIYESVTAVLRITAAVSGVEEVTVETALAYDGRTITAPDSMIELYDLKGMKTSQGNDCLDVTRLPAGVYIAVATDSYGHRTTLKILVK